MRRPRHGLDRDHAPASRRGALVAAGFLLGVAAVFALGGCEALPWHAASPTWRGATARTGSPALARFAQPRDRPPTGRLEPLPVAASVVFVVPHADDESLFAGELLNHYARASAHITVVYTTTSSGGAAQRFFPAFRAARAAVRDSVLRNLGTVEITVAPVPDGGGWGRMSGPRRLRLVHRFLTEPGVVPAGVPIFVIGGAGNSDHYIAFDEARRLAWSRNQPLYVYWGYGRDHDHLDPHRVGTPVDAQPTAGDRAFKLRAIRQYMTRLYDRYPYDRYLPNIMRLPARDDLVTELAPGTSLAGLDMPAPGHATPKPNTVAGALQGAVAGIGALFARSPH